MGIPALRALVAASSSPAEVAVLLADVVTGLLAEVEAGRAAFDELGLSKWGGPGTAISRWLAAMEATGEELRDTPSLVRSSLRACNCSDGLAKCCPRSSVGGRPPQRWELA